MEASSHPNLAERQGEMFCDMEMVPLSHSHTVDYNAAIENVCRDFYDGKCSQKNFKWDSAKSGGGD